MGTPVLTKKGFRFISRQTESANSNVDMADWVAIDDKDYVIKAIKFSADLQGLSRINKSLRKKAIKSPLFNSKLFAEDLKNAFWKMWDDFI